MTTPSSVNEAIIQATDQLTTGSTALPIEFEFNYGHARFQSRVSEIGDQRVLAITGDVGHLPFTLQNPVARKMLFQLAEESRDFKNVDFKIVHGNVIRMRHLSVIKGPLNASSVLAETIQRLFENRHFFKFINLVRN